MKAYILELKNKKTYEITEEQKRKIDDLLLRRDQSYVMLDSATFSPKEIKGVYEKEHDKFQDKQQAETINLDFYHDLDILSKDSTENKVNRELEVRIFPSAFLANKTIYDGASYVSEDIKKIVCMFFESNPRFPRCPAKYWWKMLSPYIDKSIARFYQAVSQNDNEIMKWAKYNGIEENHIQQKI